MQQAQAQVEVARAKLAQVKAGPKPEEVQAKEALIKPLPRPRSARPSETWAERPLLLERAAGSQQDFDDQTLKYEQARESVDQAKAELAAMKAIRPADIKVAEAELVQAEAGLEVARADLEAAEVRVADQRARSCASTSGRANASATRESSKSATPKIMHAVAEVYEQDVGKVEIGQKAKVRIPTLDADLTGEVVRKDLVVSRKVVFSNDPVADIDARVVEVRIQLSAEDSRKVAGLSNARAEVVIDVGGHEMRSPFRDLPIAWLQLKHGRTKLVAAVVGIVFADLLMWMQLGFLGAALASATTIHRQLRGDLVIMNPHTHQITSPQPFARRLLTRAKGHPDVERSHAALHGHGQVARPLDEG